MNYLFRQQQDANKPGVFFPIIYWLARLISFIQLTEKEKDAAGIYLGSRNENDTQN